MENNEITENPITPNIGTSEPIKAKSCINCGKKNIKKMFCSRKCYYQYNYKNDPEYKEKLKAKSMDYYSHNKAKCHAKSRLRMRQWLERPGNRQRFNDKMRPIALSFWRKTQAKRLEEGLCLRCGGPRDTEFKNCSVCLNKRRKK
jgi:hypothetical protein